MKNYDLYEKILPHVGHRIEAVSYAGGVNLAIECVDCSAVITDTGDGDEDEN